MPRLNQSPERINFEELTFCSCLFYLFMTDLKETNPDLYFMLIIMD